MSAARGAAVACDHQTHTDISEPHDEPVYACDSCGSLAWSP